MIARLIAWSARNLLLVLFGSGFAAAAGIYALIHLPLDAIPDLSDTQVIVYTEYSGQAPQVVEDQVTYPLATAMLTVPKSKVVRGFSFFGASFVYVIFEDGTDIYWARSRVLEFLNGASSRLPSGVTPTIGPDATGVGWVYQRHLEAAGFSVMVREETNLQGIRKKLGVPDDLIACHTAEAGGYVLEGHVPAAAIQRLLEERPVATGVAVPGMPVGSPGMEGGTPERYSVVLFGPDGRRDYMEFEGARSVG